MDTKQALKILRDVLGVKLSDETNASTPENSKSDSTSKSDSQIKTDTTSKADNKLPSTDGEYVLSDGRKIIVKDGKISIVEVATSDKKDETKKADEKVEVLEPAFKKEFEALKTELATLKVDFSKVSNSLADAKTAVEVLSKQPGALPITKTSSTETTPTNNIEELKAIFSEETIKQFTKTPVKKGFSINVEKFKNII
jgi:hypothetical protein